MTNNKLNMYFSLILMVMSMIMFIGSVNMIIYNFSVMLEWTIFSINSCNIYMTIIFYFMSILFLSTVMFFYSMI